MSTRSAALALALTGCTTFDAPTAEPADASSAREIAEAEPRSRVVRAKRVTRKADEKKEGVDADRAATPPAEPAPELEAMGYLEGDPVAGGERRRAASKDDLSGFSGGTLGMGRSAEVAPDVPRNLPPLRAGKTDDNAEYTAFLEFLGTWTDRAGMAAHYTPMDVRDRAYVSVFDAAGTPVADARVELLADERVVQRARTYGDGTAPVYPRLDDMPEQPDAGWTVRVRHGAQVATRTWRGDGDLELTLGQDVPLPAAVPVDVAFVLDTTGSMSDEIGKIKATLLTVTEQLEELGRPVDLRIGAVWYRDRKDSYVTRHEPFTADVAAFDRALRKVAAGGGGDTPESLNQALNEAVSDLAWRDGAAKVAFLIADAPPHMDYAQDPSYAVAAVSALARGIRVHTVAASGLDAVGSLVFRQVAQLTQGQFVFIEYGSTAASARSHGVAGAEQIEGNNLDSILYERIRDEVLGWRR